MIFSVLAFLSFILFFVTIALAIRGKHNYYWGAALSSYIFSFLAGFSIGQLTVGLPFICLILAIGYSFKWIRTKVQALLSLGIGILIAYVLVIYVDDAYLFYPFWFFVK
ncbi:hypothetical protein [Ferdinandcohnia sp. Marseille-Q9671]